MKILAINHSCVTDVNQQLYVALSRLPGVEVHLIVPDRWRDEYSGRVRLPSVLPTVDFPITHLPIAAPGNVSLHFYTRLPVAPFRRFAPDVVLSAQEPWSLTALQAVGLARRLGAPLVFQTNQNLPKRYPPPFSWIERLSYRSAAAALAYSEEARQVMLHKGLTAPSRVVPYGTDLSLFSPQPSDLRASLGLGGGVVFGYMGRFVPEKA